MIKDEIKAMTEAFRKADRASLFCEALESNNYEPCNLFETSCTRVKRRKLEASTFDTVNIATPEMLLVDEIFKNVPTNLDITLSFTHGQLGLLEKSVCVTVEKAKEICLGTMEQSHDSRWYAERSGRVTASVFGKVMNRRKSVHPASLVKTITVKTKPRASGMPASLQWRLDNERNAALKYKVHLENKENVEIKNCGFVVSPKWPMLGCSPDGIVLENGVPIGCLEIKCPYSKKDLMISEAAQGDKTFFLKMTNGSLQLRQSHAYYYQCQGVMNILGLPWIDFVVYTNIDMYVERIHGDNSVWEKRMLPELILFYLSFILPVVSSE